MVQEGTAQDYHARAILTLASLQSPPEDYEQVLALLSKDIQRRQTRLSEIRLRERRATLFVSTYTLLAWIVYTTLWYMDVLPNFTAHRRTSNFERTTKAIPVFVSPIVYVFLRLFPSRGSLFSVEAAVEGSRTRLRCARVGSEHAITWRA